MYDQFFDLNFIEELASELRKHSDNQTNKINIEQILNKLGFIAYGADFEDKNILNKPKSIEISCQFDNFLIFLKLKKSINTDLLK